ncbi:MAG: SDR family NAD(P)-dependent oxidoreductase [Deltaproteobacteria bacterium]|nr:SDR family NAD(P)-dependent oxidoreductase [Deltaproteobacteria bacterium]
MTLEKDAVWFITGCSSGFGRALATLVIERGGSAALIRAVLPGMRTRRRGRIVKISSTAGFVGFPGSGYHAATKHAVEGLSDALAKEVGPLGIHVMCVEPGPFRTGFFAARSIRQTLSRFDDYESMVNTRLRILAGHSGTQPGDPVRAAAAIIEAAQAACPPRHLILGANGLEKVRRRPPSLRRMPF